MTPELSEMPTAKPARMAAETLTNLQQRMLQLMAFGYLIFLAAYFLIPNMSDMRKVFGFLVLLPSLFVARWLWRRVPKTPLRSLLLAYIGWMLLSAFWSRHFDLSEFGKLMMYALYLVDFMMVTVYLASLQAAQLDRMLHGIALLAALVAAGSIGWWYSQHAFPQSRMVGWGPNNNPNSSAVVYGWAGLLSAHLASCSLHGPSRRVFVICALVALSVVFLTQNTGIILAATAAMSLIFLLSQQRQGRTSALGLGIVLLLIAGLVLAYSLGLLNRLLHSDLFNSVSQWRALLAWLGFDSLGIPANPEAGQVMIGGEGLTFSRAHNAFLMAVRDGGVIAGLLLTALLLAALRRSWQVFRASGQGVYLALLLFSFLCMLTETDQLISKPNYIWLMFWWPLILLIATQTEPEPVTR